MGKVCVIGGANIDICGTSLHEIREYDSNLGHVEMRFGGVGRNIAETLLKMGQKVEFVTCFSDDFFGKQLREDCIKIGLDVSKSKRVSNSQSSIYLAILDSSGDMKVAINDMRILDALEKKDLDNVIKDLKEEDLLILDSNLNEEILYYVTSHAKCIVAADPVSVAKAKRLEKSLPYLTIFKPNVFEAHFFTGIDIVDEKSASESLDCFLEKGVKEIIISLGEKGVLLGTHEGKYWFTHRTIHLENATGGGDAFLGAYLAQRLEKKSPKESTIVGVSAAVLAVEASKEEKKKLDLKKIQNAIKNMEIKEKKI